MDREEFCVFKFIYSCRTHLTSSLHPTNNEQVCKKSTILINFWWLNLFLDFFPARQAYEIVLNESSKNTENSLIECRSAGKRQQCILY
jgi:hypothetical protein